MLLPVRWHFGEYTVLKILNLKVLECVCFQFNNSKKEKEKWYFAWYCRIEPDITIMQKANCHATEFQNCTTGDAVVTASRTALTRWRLLSVKRLVTFPGRPALAVRPTLCRNSTADDANSAWAHAHQRKICEIVDDATSTTTIWRQCKNEHSLNLMRVTHNVSGHHLHHV